jgi:hypothetical protein
MAALARGQTLDRQHDVVIRNIACAVGWRSIGACGKRRPLQNENSACDSDESKEQAA